MGFSSAGGRGTMRRAAALRADCRWRADRLAGRIAALAASAARRGGHGTPLLEAAAGAVVAGIAGAGVAGLPVAQRGAVLRARTALRVAWEHARHAHRQGWLSGWDRAGLQLEMAALEGALIAWAGTLGPGRAGRERRTVGGTATDFQERLGNALAEGDPARKVAAVRELAAAVAAGTCAVAAPLPDRPPRAAGIPERPRLVPAAAVPRRGPGSARGRAALFHALAHIEFNAINLALDIAHRYPGLPPAFYADWLAIAAEEAAHHVLLVGHLRALGHDYGDFAAHDGLWQAALETADDLLARLALVPRVLEARGLDVTPGMIERLREAGDPAGVAILERILADEIGHVRAGSRWFRHLCDARGLEPGAAFLDLIATRMPGRTHAGMNRPARLAAGFTPEELDGLAALAADPDAGARRAGGREA